MPEPYYCSADDLRAELNVDSTTLADPSADRIIQDAEDIIDEELGVYPVDSTTGRKIVAGVFEAWRFTKLSRATAKLGARIYKQPDITYELKAQHVAGPDFSFSRAQSVNWGDDVEALLNQSGLRRQTMNSGTRWGQTSTPPWYSFAFNDTSMEGDVEPSPYDPYVWRRATP